MLPRTLSRLTDLSRLLLFISCASWTIAGAQAGQENLAWYSQMPDAELQEAAGLLEAGVSGTDAEKLRQLLGLQPEQGGEDFLKHLVKGIHSMKAEEFSQAAGHLEQAVELDSQQHSAWLHLIESYRLQKDNEKLLAATDGYAAAFPGNEEVRRTVGKMWMQLGEWERLQPLRKAYASSKDCCEDIDGSGLSLLEEPFLSLIQLERRLAEKPLDAEALMQMGMVLCRFGNCNEGIGYFEKLLAQQPDDLRTVLLVARAAKTINDSERGYKAAQKAEVLLEKAELPPQAQAHLRKELDEMLLHFLDRGAGAE